LKITEDNFVSYLRSKNEQALEFVIDNYGGIIQGIVKRHLYNLPEYQEECINDVLLGIWNNIGSFDESKNTFKNWAAGITKYKTIDYRRKYLKILERENIDDLEIISEDACLTQIMNQELNRDLEALLSCLKPEDKELFIKLYVEEQEIDSISKETGLKRDVIYNRISRGKKKLRGLSRLLEGRM
jgi:RNA polymerase sigma-70 factor (ECF subfamily)